MCHAAAAETTEMGGRYLDGLDWDGMGWAKVLLGGPKLRM